MSEQYTGPDRRITIDKRLQADIDEIKAALKQLAESMITLALVEERQTQAASAQERTFKAIEKLETRVGLLEKANITTAASNKWVDMAVTALVVAAVLVIARKVGLA